MKKIYLIVLQCAFIGIINAQTNVVNNDMRNLKEGEKGPSFKGDFANFFKCVNDSMIYPRDAYKNKIGGKVYLKFTIDTTGQATDIVIEKGIREDLDNEAIRILKALPFWIPGEQQGKKVRVAMSIPIKFDPNSDVKVEPKPKKEKR